MILSVGYPVRDGVIGDGGIRTYSCMGETEGHDAGLRRTGRPQLQRGLIISGFATLNQVGLLTRIMTWEG